MRNASQRAGQASDAPSTRAPSSDFTRRRFLFALGASSAGAAAAAASPTLAAPAAADAAAKSASGYRETEHVRDYYDSTRI